MPRPDSIERQFKGVVRVQRTIEAIHHEGEHSCAGRVRVWQ
jgi:hypothetical protein